MCVYITKNVSTSNYTGSASSKLKLTRIHKIEIEKKESVKKAEISYRDRHTENTQKISTANPYKISASLVYGERQTLIRSVLDGVHINYTPGDSILLWVSNSVSIRDKLMDILKIPENLWINFKRIHIRSNSVVFAFSGMASEYFQHFLDITSIPSKLFLYTLSEYAPEEHKEKLLYLAEKEGSTDYFMLGKNWNSIIDILVDFQVKIPLDALLEVCTEIKPRAFSMINRASEDCEFISAVVTNISGGVTRNGHFSTYILNQKDPAAAGLLYRVQLKENRLLRVRETTEHAFLFGIGTGIAPFISFLRNCSERCKFTLFYGCKNPEENILIKTSLACETENKSEYCGAELFRIEKTDVHVVYSQHNSFMRMGDFLAKNTELFKTKCKSLEGTDLYICGNKGAMLSISKYFTEHHPEISQYIDDWS